MRVTGDLGFSNLILVVVCVVLPVIGFVIRRKCQVAVARNEEIKRLLILAAEETERVEREALYVSAPVVFATANNYQCALCYFPATARCAKCKSVRYCSTHCQTVHWRQGHKLECHPPSKTHHSDGEISGIDKRKVEQDYSSIHEKSENREENLADTNSELSSNSFSGFSASPSSSDSSDDSSVCESIVSNEHDQSEGHTSFVPTLVITDKTTSNSNVDAAISSSPKFASLLDSVGGSSTVHKLNHITSGSSKGERKLASNGASGSSVLKGVKIEPSGFWDKALDSGGIKDNTNNKTYPSHSDESTCGKADSGLSFRFQFGTMSPLHVRDTEAKESLPNDTLPNSVGKNMPHPGSASSENNNMNSLKGRNLSFTNGDPNFISKTRSGSGSYQLESKDSSEPPLHSFSSQSSSLGKDPGSADTRSILNLQPSGSVASNHVVDNHGFSSKSVIVLCKTDELADSELASTNEGHSQPSTKHRNNDIKYGTATSSHISYSANSKSGLKTSVLKVVDQIRGSNLSKHTPLALGSDIAGKYNDKGLFPYESFVKLYNHNKVELRPFGLINCGNSCYANAVFQCLAFTPPLTAYFLQGLHSKSCANKKWCFTCEFESLILKSKDTKSPLSPMSILSQLQRIGSQLGNGQEEDAHEFIRHAIDTMQSVCLMEAGVNAPGSLEEDTTLMGQTFGGYLRSKIKCMKCGGKSERRERMMDLTVEIEGEISTLAEALRRFTSTETLDGENKYHCVRCKSYEKAKKKLTISEAPNILTVALKRFQSGKFGKLNKPIQFPEILDLAPFTRHYVCYLKNIQNKWFKVDDSVVTAVEVERVLTKGAYMLFYARCSPRAPKLIRNMILSPDSKSKVNGKSPTTKARYVSSNSGAAEPISSSVSSNSSPTMESFYSSTDSTRDSTSMDDFSDYIFGDSGHGWSSPWRTSDSDSSSSSPLNYRHSPLSDMDKYDSVSPDTTSLRIPTGFNHSNDKNSGVSSRKSRKRTD
ncbi:unnamed protein product [Vicia faba]|uniref:Uncharacterized protein n=1 Tax=Vicia faba TaxID=3906 RepID=A0AAV0ZMY4_VICFA|nr:unnamed protein product [Vicia faba]